jgi:hypothetical protein
MMRVSLLMQKPCSIGSKVVAEMSRSIPEKLARPKLGYVVHEAKPGDAKM